VQSQLPDVPFASRPAVLSIEEFVADRQVLSLMLDELQSNDAADLFPRSLRTRVCAAIGAALRVSQAPRRQPRLKQRLAQAIPESIRAAARSWLSVKPSMNPLVFAFRSFLASRM